MSDLYNLGQEMFGRPERRPNPSRSTALRERQERMRKLEDRIVRLNIDPDLSDLLVDIIEELKRM